MVQLIQDEEEAYTSVCQSMEVQDRTAVGRALAAWGLAAEKRSIAALKRVDPTCGIYTTSRSHLSDLSAALPRSDTDSPGAYSAYYQDPTRRGAAGQDAPQSFSFSEQGTVLTGVVQQLTTKQSPDRSHDKQYHVAVDVSSGVSANGAEPQVHVLAKPAEGVQGQLDPYAFPLAFRCQHTVSANARHAQQDDTSGVPRSSEAAASKPTSVIGALVDEQTSMSDGMRAIVRDVVARISDGTLHVEMTETGASVVHAVRAREEAEATDRPER